MTNATRMAPSAAAPCRRSVRLWPRRRISSSSDNSQGQERTERCVARVEEHRDVTVVQADDLAAGHDPQQRPEHEHDVPMPPAHGRVGRREGGHEIHAGHVQPAPGCALRRMHRGAAGAQQHDHRGVRRRQDRDSRQGVAEALTLSRLPADQQARDDEAGIGEGVRGLSDPPAAGLAEVGSPTDVGSQPAVDDRCGEQGDRDDGDCQRDGEGAKVALVVRSPPLLTTSPLYSTPRR